MEVARVVHRSGFFYVLGGFVDGRKVSASGQVMLDLEADSVFTFVGEWTTHPKYGRQLTILSAPVVHSTTPRAELQRVLWDWAKSTFPSEYGSPMGLLSGDSPLCFEDFLKAQPPAWWGQYVRTQGEETWTYLRNCFKHLCVLGDLRVILTRVDLKPAIQLAVFRKWEEKSLEILRKDPWKLAVIPGVSWEAAEQIATQMGISPECGERVQGAVLFAFRSLKSQGHVFLRAGELLELAGQFLGGALGTGEIAQALKELQRSGYLVLDRTTREGTVAVYSRMDFHHEETAARYLAKRMLAQPSLPTKIPLSLQSEGIKALLERGASDLELAGQLVLDWEAEQKSVRLTELQKQAVVWALVHPVSVLTGGPGTGKTTTLRALVDLLRGMGVGFELMAPTGIAAKRLSHVASSPAATVHRALGSQASKDKSQEDQASYVGVLRKTQVETLEDSKSTWGCTPSNPHPTDFVVLDESSMLDLHLLFRVLDGTKPSCRLLFVGDVHQLPSVSSGDVLRSLIDSGVLPVTTLDQVFRQAGGSDIVEVARSIRHGETPDTSGCSDFVFEELTSEEAVFERVCGLVTSFKDKTGEFAGDRDKSKASLQLISPRHKGTLGVTNLNRHLREMLNPAGPGVREVAMGAETLRQGDRVMVVQNSYQLGIFNGDIGKLEDIVSTGNSTEIRLRVFGPQDDILSLEKSDASDLLRLAYAMTVHKSQGCEFDYVVLPLMMSFGHQLQRNLLYTAITRAKRKVFVIGQFRALHAATQNAVREVRNTLLAERLRVRCEHERRGEQEVQNSRDSAANPGD